MNFLELIWHDHIKYFAISNVESSNDLKKYVDILPDHITIVPKIESPAAVENIQDIVDALPSEKFLMLDHDDLFSSFILMNKNIH
jgi:pyruvate kinase